MVGRGEEMRRGRGEVGRGGEGGGDERRGREFGDEDDGQSI